MKRILSFILSVLILVSILPLTFTVSYADEGYSDEYYYASDFLKSVCPDIPIGSDGNYTRGEFVAAVVKLLNISPSGGEASFSDVKDHIYSAYIARGAYLGLIDSQNMFYPDSPITYSQALKIMTVAIGYGERASLTGGFPAGYIKAANDAGIGKNVSLTNLSTPLSYKDGASLLYDMATAEVLEATSYGDKLEYSTQKGKNILSLYHDIHISEGIIEANEYTGLNNKDKFSGKGTFKIKGVEFHGGSFYKLLGQNVRVFYKDDKARTVVYAYPYENEILKTTPEHDIRINGTSFELTSPDGKKKDYRLSSGYAVIYNGKNLYAFDFNSYVNPQAGNVTITDHDKDGRFDVFYVESIEYGVVDRVNSLEEKIYDKYRQAGVTDLSGYDTSYFIFDKDKNPIGLEEIEDDSVVGFITSQDKKLIEIHIYDNACGGVFNEKTSDGKLVLNGNEYDLSSYYTTNIRLLSEIKLGTQMLCYLGEGNDIVYIEEVSRDMNYGFLVDIGEEGSLNKTLVAKIMTSANGMTIIPLAQKTIIDDSPKSVSEAKTSLLDIMKLDTPYRVIKYALNSDKEIVKIYSADDSADISSIYEEYSDNSAPKIYMKNQNCRYYSGLFSPYLRPSSATEAIVVTPYTAPAGESAEDTAKNKLQHMKNDENYMSVSMPGLENDKTHNITAYDVDASGQAQFIIVNRAAAAQSADETTGWAVVEKVAEMVNSESEVLLTLRAYTGGQYKFLYVSDKSPAGVDASVRALKPGDIIRVSYENDNTILAVTRDFDGINKTVIDASNDMALPGLGKILEYINGYVYSLSGQYAILAPKSTDFTQPILPLNTILLDLGRGTTIFCKINKDRNGNVIDASCYKEPNYLSVETRYNSGDSADYIVSRQRFRDPYLNVIYVD